jgi:integrase
MASKGLYKRGETWWARIWVPAQQREHRASLFTADESEAETKLAALKAELEEFDGASPTWKAAMVNWAELVYSSVHDDDGLRQSTREGYRELLMAVSSQWRDRKLSEIGPKAIGEWVRLRKRGFTYRDEAGEEHTLRPCANATARRSLTAISSVFRAAQAAGLCHSNPVKLWDRKIIPEKRRYFTPPLVEEIELVLSYASGNLRRGLELLASTGMRENEAKGLQWRDVRPEEGYLLLQPTTKARRPRVVRLSTPGGDAARTLSRTKRHPFAQHVIWHAGGQPYASISAAFACVLRRARACEEMAGRPFRAFRLHDLRHAFACRWLLAGGDLYELSKHLGHTSVKTTEGFYLCMIEGYQERAAAYKAGGRSHNLPHDFTGSNVVPFHPALAVGSDL